MTSSTEVSYLFAMLRRRARVLLLGLSLGILVAVLLGTSADRYQAQAQLLIGAPSTSNADANSLERNLTSQLSVLRSRETARAVTERLAGELTTQEVLSATTIEPVAGADVVLIQTTAARPAQAEAIAGAYASVYIKTSAERARARVAPELRRLDVQLTLLDGQIATTNESIARAVAPFLQRTGPGASIPDPRTVAPEAAARQQLLLNEYDRLLQQRQDIEQAQQLRNASSVLQEAVADEEPLGPDRRRQLGVILIAGFVSVAVALAIDTLSGRAVSELDVEQALGARIAATFRRDRRLRGSPAAVLDPRRAPAEGERLLGLRAERQLTDPGPTVIVVAGAARGCGTTTVAMSLARHFATSGRTTILVDAVGGPGSLTAVLCLADHGGASVAADGSADVASALVTVLDDLHVLPNGAYGDGLSRTVTGVAIDELEAIAEVVVFDAGTVFESSLSVSSRAQMQVIAVDGEHTKIRRLEELGLILADFRGTVLPVLTHPSRRRRPDRGGSAAALPGGAVELAPRPSRVRQRS